MASDTRPLAIVTGASSGIGYELAKCCAQNGYDLIVAADEPAINDAAQTFRNLGVSVEAVQADLATIDGVDRLYAAATGRPVEALLDSFAFALRAELKDTGVTVTCLMPGATETEFFERADMMDTKVGTAKKDDAAQVARTGFDAMMRGTGDVVAGWHNKLQTAIANVTPPDMLAEQHRKMAEPGSGTKK